MACVRGSVLLNTMDFVFERYGLGAHVRVPDHEQAFFRETARSMRDPLRPVRGTLWLRGTILILVTVAFAAGAVRAQEPNRSNPERDLGYRIGPEDILQIAVWNNEALSRVVPVRPDGMISLPLLNDIQAAGLTPMELRDFLAKRLTEYIPQPEVSVIVTEVRSYKVSVLGQVMKPGRYDLKSWSTVLDVLAMAGGFTEFAARSRIVVLRTDGKNTKRIPFNYEKVVSEGGEQVNMYLRPGDIVLVP